VNFFATVISNSAFLNAIIVCMIYLMQSLILLFVCISRIVCTSVPETRADPALPEKPFFRRNFRKGMANFGKALNRLVNGAVVDSGDTLPQRAQSALPDDVPLSDARLLAGLSRLNLPKPISMMGDSEAVFHANQELFDSPEASTPLNGHSFVPIESKSEKRSSVVSSKVPERRARSLTPSMDIEKSSIEDETTHSTATSSLLRGDLSMTPINHPASDIRQRYKMFLEQQGTRDLSLQSRCTPDLAPRSFTDRVPSGRFVHLSSRLYASRMSTVFSISGSDDLVAKYQSDCFEGSQETHPLIKDFFMYNEVQDLGISPKAFFVSPPTSDWPEEQPHGTFAKAGFTMTTREYETCSKGSAVRFIIMEKVGESLSSLIRTTHVGFVNAIMMGIEMIETIRILHQEKEIIHGDIHQGNFVLHNGRIKVIDFGRFEWINLSDNQPGFIRRPFKQNHVFFSHWEIAGFKNTRRDDVFKAIMIAAAMMNGKYFNTYIGNDIYGDTGLSFAVKAYKNLFVLHEMTDNKYIGDPLLEHPSQNATTHENVRNRLRVILKHTRSLDLHEEPDYKLVLSNLCSIADAMMATRVQMEKYDGLVAQSICLSINQRPPKN